MRYRIERDSLGERQVPAEAYYGIETLRGKENFEITKRGICRQLIKALAIVKKPQKLILMRGTSVKKLVKQLC